MRFIRFGLAGMGLMLCATSPLLAEESSQERQRSYTRYDAPERYNYALGVSFGIDRLGITDNGQGTGVTYFNANFRFNTWGDEDRDRLSREGRGGLKGYLEAEVGYWNDSRIRPFDSDLLIGLNAVVAYPTGSAEVFFGAGFGYHFFNSSLSLEEGVELETSDRGLGGNLQFGVDLNFSDAVSLFGLGRYDILRDDVFGVQAKIGAGLRFKF